MKLSKNRLIGILSEALFPASCLLCASGKALVCQSCEKRLSHNTHTISDWTLARYNYNDNHVKKLLFKLKYNHTPQIGTLLGEYNAKWLRDTLSLDPKSSRITLIPIPLSYQRQQQRGYNQAYKIAEGLAQGLQKIKIEATVSNLLARHKDTEKLHRSTNKEERFEELYKAFTINPEVFATQSSLNESQILLIDDITTSGATFYEARRALVEAGIDEKRIKGFALGH